MKVLLGFAVILLVLLIGGLTLLPSETDKYTELYFDNPTALPTTMRFGESVPISFIIRNEEKKDMSYVYTITVASGETRRELNRGTVSLPKGRSIVVSSAVELPADMHVENKTLDRMRFEVTILHDEQSIHFWIKPT